MRRRKDEEREAKERLEVGDCIVGTYVNVNELIPILKQFVLFLQEEEALARKAKEEEAAALEFEKWKDEFSVDAEGTTESDMHDDGQGLLSSFVEYIKVYFFIFPFRISFYSPVGSCFILSENFI